MSYINKLYTHLYKDVFECSSKLADLKYNCYSGKLIVTTYHDKINPYITFFPWVVLHNSCTWNNIGLNLSWKFGYELDLSLVPACKLMNPTYQYTLVSDLLKSHLNWMSMFPKANDSSFTINPSLLLKSPNTDMGLSLAKNSANSGTKSMLLLTN